MKVFGFVGLCIYLMILYTILSFVDSLDKGCDCSKDSSKTFIDKTVPVLALISTLVFSLSLTNDKLLRGFSVNGDQFGVARVNYAFGYLEMNKGYHKKATKFHDEAYQIFNELGRKVWMKITEHQLGNCHYYNYEDKKALGMFEEVLQFELESGNAIDVFTAQFMIGVYSSISGNYKKAKRQLRGCLSVFEEGESEWHLMMQSMVKHNLAWINYFEGKFDQCIDELETLASNLTTTPRLKSCMHAGLGRIYIETGEYAKAEQNHRECVKIRLLQGARLGDWYEKHQFTNPNADWNYPPDDLSEDRYDMMWPK